MENKVWFVTGASKGLGYSLVKKLLQEGYRVAATSRDKAALETIETDRSRFLPLAVDLGNEESVAQSIKATVDHFGSIDVIVNNAGYGLAGALEELSDAEARQNFDVNVFGSLNVIRQALPYLRAQQSGHIFNISSVAGFTGFFPGFGIYCATKFALTGLSESLAAEVKPFGIHVTVVSPGYFRTRFLDASSLVVPAQEIADYRNVRDVQGLHQHEINGNQPGDPEKATAAIIETARQQEPVLHLFLGKDAYNFAEEKITAIRKDMEQVKELATSTDFE